MNIPNRLTIRQIFDDPDRIKDMPLGVLKDVLEASDETRRMAEVVKKIAIAEVLRQHGDAIKSKYLAEGKDTGTIHVLSGEHDIECKTPKSVEWDQPFMAGLYAKIKATGEDPADYIVLEYGVEEKKYAAWPAGIRKTFEAARIVKPGNPTIVISEAKVQSSSWVDHEDKKDRA